MRNLSAQLSNAILDRAEKIPEISNPHLFVAAYLSSAMGDILESVAEKHPHTRATIENILSDYINAVQNQKP